MTDPLSVRMPLQPRGPAGAFVLTDEQVAAVGGGAKAFPVRVEVNGHVLSLRLARMGGENLIGLNKAIRAEAGVELGGDYDVVVSADSAPREVEVPPDLAAALAAAGLTDAFAALAPSRRKEHARSVTEAKKAETRAARVDKVLTALRG